jgi:hypothetical protein
MAMDCKLLCHRQGQQFSLLWGFGYYVSACTFYLFTLAKFVSEIVSDSYTRRDSHYCTCLGLLGRRGAIKNRIDGCLHYGENRSKLGCFKIVKYFFCFLKCISLERFSTQWVEHRDRCCGGRESAAKMNFGQSKGKAWGHRRLCEAWIYFW